MFGLFFLSASTVYLFCTTYGVLAAPYLTEGNTGNGTGGYRVERVNSCPKDWTRYDSSKCFRFFATKLKYRAALEACESLDSTLACLASDDEHEFLKSYIVGQYKKSAEVPDIWIGGEAKASRWFWTDFTLFKFRSRYTSTGNLQPSSWFSDQEYQFSDGRAIALGTRSSLMNDNNGAPNPNWGHLKSDSVEDTYAYICQVYQADVRETVTKFASVNK